jgi:hypothetical protein
MTQDLVPDREICQEAKDKGVVIESEYWWWKATPEDKYYLSIKKGDRIETLENSWFTTFGHKEEEYCPAPLTDEILKVLPDEINLTIVKEKENIFCVSAHIGIEKRRIIEYGKKLSNALLLLAIKLVDEGLLKIY